MHLPPLPPGGTPGSSVRCWVNPRATVRPEALSQCKSPMTPSGIEPATSQLVAQCLNQLGHCVTFFSWIGHILRRNCLVKQIIEGNIKGQIEVTRRRGRRRKKLLDDLKDKRGYCQLKEEALDRTMWRNRFGRGFGPVVWQITDDDERFTVKHTSIVRKKSTMEVRCEWLWNTEITHY